MDHRQRMRFTLNDDMTLLKETLLENPFESADKWRFIQEKVYQASSKMFSIRSLKEHLQHLIVSFTKQTMINKKKYATEEEFNNLKILLQDVIDLSKEFKNSSNKSKTKRLLNDNLITKDDDLTFSQLVGSNKVSLSTDNLENCVFEVQLPGNDSLQQVSEESPSSFSNILSANNQNNGPSNDSLHSTLSNNNKKRNFMLKFVKEKQQKEQAMRKEELEIQCKKLRLEEVALELEKNKLRLEEERLDFERVKYETEAKEREVRLQLEVEERKERLKSERDQRQMLLEMFQSLIDKNQIK